MLLAMLTRSISRSMPVLPRLRLRLPTLPSSSESCAFPALPVTPAGREEGALPLSAVKLPVAALMATSLADDDSLAAAARLSASDETKTPPSVGQPGMLPSCSQASTEGGLKRRTSVFTITT